MFRTLPTTLGRAQCRAVATANKTALVSTPRFELSSELFDDIRSRLKQDGRTVEKIVVTFRHKNGTKTNYLMNKNVSTAYDCARHLNMMVARRAVLSLVSYPDEDAVLQSMNEPLRDRCNFELIDFQTEGYAEAVNQAYWRSCSIVLAAALLRGTKEHLTISNIQCEFPKPYFAVDVNGLRSRLSEDDLKDLSSFARHEIIFKGIPFETVTLPSELAVNYGFASSVRICRWVITFLKLMVL
ncbi:hypothetical protein KIN20_006300 [Parelaphostrongylus tenuis]|uniref:39S ribosomal protein L39, mitochondrial n=1 Tax=Parelaphostrongylus tenuis TaxID=148309 RepID=A0AAD5QFW2_PARTN|nr:hypothetical protein KIN20_006300 [Parelaphostrongylus tenuis]